MKSERFENIKARREKMAAIHDELRVLLSAYCVCVCVCV